MEKSKQVSRPRSKRNSQLPKQKRAQPRQQVPRPKPNMRPPPPRRAYVPISSLTAAGKEAEFNAMCKRLRISQLGSAWMRQVLDPYHDVQMDPVGVPDSSVGKSVVRRVEQTVTLACPSGAANPNFSGASTWTAHLVVQPWLQRLSMSEFTRVNNDLITIIGAPTEVGGFQAFATPGNGNLNYGSTGPTQLSPEIASMEIDPAYSKGVGRLVSLGLEIINTTSELNRQGSMVCWRAPEPHISPTLLMQTPANGAPILRTSYCFSAQMFRYPPVNPAEALLYNSTQWRAEEGAYMVSTFHEANPPQAVAYTVPYFGYVQNEEDQTYEQDLATSNSNQTPLWCTNTVPNTIGGQLFLSLPAVKLYPINQMGAILSGLSIQSTITVRMVYYYESFPSLADVSILSLARPASPYDPVALEYVSRITRRLPAACMVKDNPAGEWFAFIMEGIAAAVSYVGNAVGAPLLGAAGSAALIWGAQKLREAEK